MIPASRPRLRLVAAAAAAAWCWSFAPSVRAGEPAASGVSDRDSFLHRVLARVDAELEAASAELEPPLVPPVPIAVKWKARRIASLDLGAPLLSLTAADVDGDRRAELLAVTTRELVVIGAGRKPVIVGRAALPAVAASLRPRDPVGVVVATRTGDQVAVAARSSEQALGARFEWRDGKLVESAREPGFPLGGGARAELAPGRNYFTADRLVRSPDSARAAPPSQFYSAIHRDGLVDPDGRPLVARGYVGTDGHLYLHLQITCRPTAGPCPVPVALPPLPHVGVAAAVADVDHDGHPELVTAGDRPPGDPDRVTVVSARDGRLEPVYTRRFSGGVVGLAIDDLDGDGDLDVVCAVRLLGSTRIDLWKLD